MKIAIIYKIRNLVSNDSYVGSTTNFSRRIKRHLDDLCKGSHHSIILQRAYNKYGKDGFLVSIIETFPYFNKNEILQKEQYYIDRNKCTYNICKIAGSQLGSKRSEEFRKKCSERMKGIPAWNKGLKTGCQSEETKQKRSKSLIGGKRSIETKILMSKKAKGRKFTDEHKEKLSKSHIKHGKYCRK